MERQASVFPWVPEYENRIHQLGSVVETEEDPGLIGRVLVAVSELIVSSVELYLLFFATCVVTVIYNSQ